MLDKIISLQRNKEFDWKLISCKRMSIVNVKIVPLLSYTCVVQGGEKLEIFKNIFLS